MLDGLIGPSGWTSLGIESAARERKVDRIALIVFGVVVAAAFPLLLFWGRHGWFTQDDWDFLSARTIGNLGDLFRPHFQHLVLLPIAAYRLLWVVFGIRSYVPYQVLIVGLHLIAAGLLRAVMRRAGVAGWLATIAAAVFVFFGAGAENMVVAFQITFVGALVFGLVQLLAADHDGPLGRRDWLGLLAGFAGLLCSGVALTMTVIVGLAVLLRRGRRGWRVALFHTVPILGAYLVWLAVAPTGQDAGNYRSHSITQVARFAAIGVEAAFARLGHVPGLGILLAILLVVGIVLLARANGRGVVRGRFAVPVALIVGAIVFLVVTGVARAGQGGLLFLVGGTGPERARDSRYVYLVAAMLLPALALAIDTIVRRRQLLAIPAAAVLLAGVPGNIRQLQHPDIFFANGAVTRVALLDTPRLPMVEQLRHSHEPLPTPAFQRLGPEGLTFGWLVDSYPSGRIPKPPGPPANPIQLAGQALRFFLVPAAPAAPGRCEPLRTATIRVLARDELLTIERGDVFVNFVPIGGQFSFRQLVPAGTVKALVGPMRLRIKPAEKGVMLCD